MKASNNKPWYIAFGTGIDSPALVRCSEEEHIRQSMRACVLTRRGECASHPELGSRVVDFMFRPLIDETRSALAAAIRHAVTIGEPRVEIQAVELSVDELEPGALIAQLRYRILSSKRSERMLIRLKP